MITNIYEFYLEDGDKDQPKNQLQEVTQVSSDIDVELSTPEVKISESVSNITDSSGDIKIESNIISPDDSVNIQELAKESKKIGESSAEMILSLIEPAIDSVRNEISKEVKSKLDKSDNTIAVVTEGNISSNSSNDILLQYESNINNIILEALDKLNDSDPRRLAQLVSDLNLVSTNDLAREEFELKVKDNLFSQFNIDIQGFDKYEDLTGYIKSELLGLATSVVDTTINTLDHVSESILRPLSKVIDAVVIDSWMDPLKATANTTNAILNATNEVVHELSDQVSGVLNNLRKNEQIIIRAFTMDLVGVGQDWVQNNILNETAEYQHRINSAIDNVTNDLITSLPWASSVTGTPNEPVSSLSFMGNKWSYLRNTAINKSYYRFATTFDWLIKIVPNTNGMPSLTEMLDIGYTGFLPILNYNLVEAGLDSVSYQVLTNTVIIPQGYRRPSKLSITLPDMYVDNPDNEGIVGRFDGRTYLRNFKEEYIKYVKSPTKDINLYSLISRDYRECCYQITLYRFPYIPANTTLDNFSFKKTYLGIPEISISESGNDSKQLITDVLTFNIVGEMN